MNRRSNSTATNTTAAFAAEQCAPGPSSDECRMFEKNSTSSSMNGSVASAGAVPDSDNGKKTRPMAMQ